LSFASKLTCTHWQDDPFGSYKDIQAAYIVGFLTFCQICANVMKLGLFLVVDAPLLHIGHTEEEEANILEDSMDNLLSMITVDQEEDVGFEEDFQGGDAPRERPFEKELLEKPEEPYLRGVWHQLASNCFRSSSFWQNVATFTIAVYIGCSGAESNFLVAFLLLDYFRQPAGVDILKSVNQGGAGLLNSFKCGFVLIIIWGCLSFQIFQDEINPNNGCRTAYQCITHGIDAGIHGDFAGLHGTDFEDLMPAYPLRWNSNLKQHPLQWMFVTFFFLAWEYILAGIVQGQIVDAFSAIRAEVAPGSSHTSPSPNPALAGNRES
jgi:hypothetical protein